MKPPKRRVVASTALAAYAAPSTQPVGALELQPEYFPSLAQVDKDPILVHALTTSHPDSVLRRLGVIYQTGVHKGHRVYYNPRSCLWHRIDNDKIVSPNPLPEDVSEQQHSAPSGIIHIFGDDGCLAEETLLASQLQQGIAGVPGTPGGTIPRTPRSTGGQPFNSDPRASSVPTSTASGPDSISYGAVDQQDPLGVLYDAHRRNLRMMEHYHKTLIAPADDGDGGGDELKIDAAHQKLFLRQYLSRALPAAAVRTNAVLVLTHGNGAVAEQVSLGISALRSSRTQVAAASNNMSAIAVTPFREHIKPLYPNITHHVMLRRSMVSRLPRAVPTQRNTCRGWLVSADTVDNVNQDHQVCVRCGQLREWHVPYEIYRTCRLEATSLASQQSQLQQQQQQQLQQQQALLSSSSHQAKKHNYSSRVVPAGEDECYKDSMMFDDSGTVNNKSMSDPTLVPISEQPNGAELDTYVGRMIDQLSVGCRQNLLIPGRREEHKVILDRPAIPVVVVLIGGSADSARRYIAQCLTRRYTVLVIEGSGGYADYLWEIRRSIDRAFPDAGRDGIRRYSTALDPLTSEILSNFDLVRFIRRGAKNEEIVRQIEGALKGDSALQLAWSAYALYHENAKRQRNLFTMSNLLLMFLGLFVTFLTTIQAFFMLRMAQAGESTPPTIPDAPDERGTWFLWKWTLMQWSIIVLPIIISAIQGMLVKYDFGGKWIALRTTSQRLLSEIYQYRTSCLKYEDNEMRRKRKTSGLVSSGGGGGGDTAGGGGGSGNNTSGQGGGGGEVPERAFKSKEDLLQQRAQDLTEQLLKGSCRQLKLSTRGIQVPPHSIVTVDDGFSALTPDQYVRVRLRHMIEHFENEADWFAWFVQICYNSITVTNGVGTGLAAIAAYTDSTLQTWLALSTAIVATLLRALESFRLDFQSKKKVIAARNLRNIGAWWGSLSEHADTKSNRDLLVEQVENVVLDEVNAWAQQFGQALEDIKDDFAKQASQRNDGGDNDDGNDGGGGDDDDENGGGAGGDAKTTLKDLELTELSWASLSRMLTDNTMPDAQRAQVMIKVKSLKQRLLDGSAGSAPKTSKGRKEADMNKLRERAARDFESLQAGRSRRGDCVSAIREIVFVSLADADILPQQVEDVLRSRSIRFLDYLKMSSSPPLPSKNAAAMAADADSPRDTGNGVGVSTSAVGMRRVSSRSMSVTTVATPAKEVARQNAEKLLYREQLANAKNISFQESLEALRSIPELAPFVDDLPYRHVIELCKRLVCENIYDEVKRGLDRVNIRKLCSPDVTVEDLVSQFAILAQTPRINEFGMNGVLLLIRNTELRNNLATLHDAESCVAQLVDKCLEVFHPEVLMYVLFERYCSMAAEVDVDVMMQDTDNIVALARCVESLWQYGIRTWVMRKEELLDAFPDATRQAVSKRSHIQLAAYVDQVLSSKPALTSVELLAKRYGRDLFSPPLLALLLSHKENQVRFATAVENVSQHDILVRPSSTLLRQMDFEGATEIQELLMKLPPTQTRLALSILQTMHTNSYGATLVDATCDSIVAFSLRQILNYEKTIRLVDKLSELRVSFLNECQTKPQILKLFGFRQLTESLDKLSYAQLKEMFYAFQQATCTDWTVLQAGFALRVFVEEEVDRAGKRDGSNAATVLSKVSQRRKSLARDLNQGTMLPGGGGGGASEGDVETTDMGLHTTPTTTQQRTSPSFENAEGKPTRDTYFEEQWIQEIYTWTGKIINRMMWVAANTSASVLCGIDDRVSANNEGGVSRGGKMNKSNNNTTNDDDAANATEPLTARSVQRKLSATLIDAPDQVVLKALRSFTPEQSRTLLWRLQPLGVEADTSRLFSMVLSLGGYDPKIVDALEEGFRSWEVRQAFVEAFGNMMLDSSFDPFESSPESFLLNLEGHARKVKRVVAIADCDQRIFPEKPSYQPESVRVPQLNEPFMILRGNETFSTKIPPGTLYDFLFNVFTELRHSAALLVFYRLAALCKFVDLRELYDTVEERVEFITTLTLTIMDEKSIFNKSIGDMCTPNAAASSSAAAGAGAAGGGGTTPGVSNLNIVSPHGDASDFSRTALLANDTSSFTLFSYKIFSEFGSVDCRLMNLGDGTDSDVLPEGFWKQTVLRELDSYLDPIRGKKKNKAAGGGGGSVEYEEEEEGEITLQAPPQAPPPPAAAAANLFKTVSIITPPESTLKAVPSSSSSSSVPPQKPVYDLQRVVSSLHVFTEPLLRFIFECHAKVLQSTIGRFFVKLVTYKRHGGRERELFPIIKDLSLRESFVMDVALSNLIRCAKISSEEMANSLDHFEPDKFSVRQEQDRRAVLSRWMSAGSDVALELLVKASDYDVQEESSLAASVKLSRTRTLEGGRSGVMSGSLVQHQSSGGSLDGGGTGLSSSEKKKFFRYVFKLLKVAKPDEDQNPLDKFTFAYESRLTQILTGHVTLKSLAEAQLFASRLKTAAAMKKPLATFGKRVTSMHADAGRKHPDAHPARGGVTASTSLTIGQQADSGEDEEEEDLGAGGKTRSVEPVELLPPPPIVPSLPIPSTRWTKALQTASYDEDEDDGSAVPHGLGVDSSDAGSSIAQSFSSSPLRSEVTRTGGGALHSRTTGGGEQLATFPPHSSGKEASLSPPMYSKAAGAMMATYSASDLPTDAFVSPFSASAPRNAVDTSGSIQFDQLGIESDDGGGGGGRRSGAAGSVSPEAEELGV